MFGFTFPSAKGSPLSINSALPSESTGYRQNGRHARQCRLPPRYANQRLIGCLQPIKWTSQTPRLDLYTGWRARAIPFSCQFLQMCLDESMRTIEAIWDAVRLVVCLALLWQVWVHAHWSVAIVLGIVAINSETK